MSTEKPDQDLGSPGGSAWEDRPKRKNGTNPPGKGGFQVALLESLLVRGSSKSKGRESGGAGRRPRCCSGLGSSCMLYCSHKHCVFTDKGAAMDVQPLA